MKTAKQSTKGKFLIAKGAGHGIVTDRPDLVIKASVQVLDTLEGKTTAKLDEESLPKLNETAEFFVDGELADYVRSHPAGKGIHEKLRDFCRQLRLGFNEHGDFGYVDHRKNDTGGYFIACK